MPYFLKKFMLGKKFKNILAAIVIFKNIKKNRNFFIKIVLNYFFFLRFALLNGSQFEKILLKLKPH